MRFDGWATFFVIFLLGFLSLMGYIIYDEAEHPGPTLAQAANHACHHHGGVRSVNVDPDPIVVVCQDGVVVQL